MPGLQENEVGFKQWWSRRCRSVLSTVAGLGLLFHLVPAACTPGGSQHGGKGLPLQSPFPVATLQ